MQQEQFQPTITFLNLTGDVTIAWDAKNREEILALIEKKMAEGYSFFIMKPRMFGLFGLAKKPLQSINDARDAGSVIVPDSLVKDIAMRLGDQDVENVVSRGAARVVEQTNVATLDTTRRATSAQEVLENQTVGVRRVVGG